MNGKKGMAVLIVALLLVLGAAVWWTQRVHTPELEMPGLQWFDPPVALDDDGLQQTDGTPFRWAWKQGWTVAFFGYTHCPDFCPDTLAVLARVESRLSSQAPAHRVVFVSVDPYRDDAERLREYLDYFDERFIAVSGTVPVLERLARQSGAFFDYEDPETGEAIAVPDREAKEKGYTVNHFGALIVVDPEGRVRGHLYPPLDVERVSRLIRALSNT